MTTPLLVSVADLRRNYLHGVTARNAAGEELPDSAYEYYLRAAQSQISNYLLLTLVPTTIVDEQHAYSRIDMRQHAFLRLRKGPVRSVERIQIRWTADPAAAAIDFPLAWVTWNPASYQPRLQIVPGTGTYNGALISGGGQFLPLLARGAFQYVPDIFRVSYTAGLDVDSIDVDLLHAIAMTAAIGPLNIAGDLIAGAGIASKSMSIPGLSQSISTTSSATNSGYGSRIVEYQKELKELLPQLRARYGANANMVVA